MPELDRKAASVFAGKVVRKDLVRKVKVGANVPVFVLEYLLGKYCATDDPVRFGRRQILGRVEELRPQVRPHPRTLHAGLRPLADPIKDKSQRLQTVIDLQAARKTQGLPPDGRLSALVNELTDALGDEAKGKEQAIDEATSFIVGTLSSRLLESLFSSCRYIELLMDSKHRSDALAAICDLTRLEFLRSYYGQRRMGVPSQFTSINEDDLNQFAHECEQQGDSLGSNAIQFANALGSTPDDVRNFVSQLKEEIRRAAQRDADERGNQSSS